jgi:hypothetical protein
MITILRDPEIADKLVYIMKDDGRRVGGITSVLTGDGDLMITALDSEVELYYDGLVRAVLAYAATRGIDRAVFNISDERQLRRLKGFGFITDESRVLESISDFFSAGCKSE